MNPIRVDVIAPVFEGQGLCSSCELVLSQAGVSDPPAMRALAEYPQDWQDDYRRLTEWVHDLADRYGGCILIRLIDPQSPQGLIKSIRYRIRKYPTFVIQGKTKVTGWRREPLESAIESALAAEQG